MKEQIDIRVEVPRQGLNRYEFLGAGYVHNEPVADRRVNWPVARGIPLPEGAVHDVNALALCDTHGRKVPRQVRPLASWPDGSVMFALVAWQTDVAHDAPALFTLALSGGEDSPEPAQPVVVREREDRITIDSGILQATIRRDNDAPHLSLSYNDRRVFAGEIELTTVDSKGAEHSGVLAGPQAVRVVEAGPLYAVIQIAGQHASRSGAVFLDYLLQLRFDAGVPRVLMSHTFLNLGDEHEGVAVGKVSLRLPPVMPGNVQHIIRQTAAGTETITRYAEFPEDVEINVGAEGPRIADPTPFREDVTGYPPYVMKYRHHVDHWLGVRTDAWTWLCFVHEARENWPKRLLAQSGRLTLDLWPRGAQLQTLRQGMARTHRVELAFFEPDAPAVQLHTWCAQVHSPANVVMPFEWYQRCRVLGMEHILAWMPARYRLLEGRLLSMIERGWASGMLNYGDDPDRGYTASYAALGVTTDTVWINNEHDFISQAVIQYWRSNRPGAWKSARVAAEHQIDVDFVRRSDDRWKQGGIPAHCAQHTTAAAYPSHLWTEGLLQYYLTSGDVRALEAARSVAHLVCQYVEERYQALVSESRMEGWALIALAAIIEVTRDERCLRAAHKIVRRIREVIARTGSYDSSGMNYGTGTVLTGLANLHRATADSEALALMLEILDWHLEHGRNAMGIAWGDQWAPYPLNLTLPAYAYAWHASGNRKYLEAGLEFFRFTGPPPPQDSVRGAGKCYRTYVPFLKVAHEAGALEEIEKRME